MKHDHDRGLAHDLEKMRQLATRRQILRGLVATSVIPLVGCVATTTAGTGGSGAGGSGGSSGNGGGSGSGECTVIPGETAGPYPGDGTNGPNALTVDGIIRSDMRSSVGTLSGTAAGVELTITLTILDASDGCTPLASHAVYLWHCDQDGHYSLYDITDQNYLRGVQETDANGEVTFTTIFPGCYAGRWPHMHFEIFSSLDSAVLGGNAIATSQLAMPEAACNEVYATSGYEASVSNLTQSSLTSDNVFRDDGAAHQLASVSGSVAAGYMASLEVGVSG